MKTPSLICLRMLHILGASYVLSLTLCLYVVDIFYLCPAYYAADEKRGDNLLAPTCFVPATVGIFFVCQMLVNFTLFHYSKRFNKAQALFKTTFQCAEGGYKPVHSTSQMSKHCEKCQMQVPLRCYHCSVCGFCVLKKDHHCFVIGGCVGFANQRYFIVFIFWALIGSAYGILYILQYLNRFYQPIFSSSMILYFAPAAMLSWFFAGKISFYHVAIVLLFNIAGTGLISSAAFLIGQFFSMIDDRTMFERVKFRHEDHAIPRYLIPLRHRLRTVFGPWCILNFLVPLPFKNELDPSFQQYAEENALKIV